MKKITAVVKDPATEITEEFTSNYPYYSDPIANAIAHLAKESDIEWVKFEETESAITKQGTIKGTQKVITINLIK